MSVLVQHEITPQLESLIGQTPGEENDARPWFKIVERILSETYVQKAWRIAGKVRMKHDAPDLYPHLTFPGLPYYIYHDSTFWTSGIFPGGVWVLYERSLKHQLSVPSDSLLITAKKWQGEIAKEQHKTDNHDLSFMIRPSFARDYDLTSSMESLQIVLNAAEALSTRFSYSQQRFFIVIDSMMNLDLLYYAAEKSGNAKHAEIATKHAITTLKNHIRSDNSSYHVVNYDARTGAVRNQVTNQGYANGSTWARGQAWALYGFASVYKFTRQDRFLEAAKDMADYFLSRVEDDGTVYWDFDAPRLGVWDVSAATCACSGMLLLQQLAPEKCNYLQSVLRILSCVTERASSTGDTLLERSTMNDHKHAIHRTAEHGVIYADYYFLEAGN